MTIWRMRIVRRIPKATNTLRIRNTYCFCTATMVAPTCLNVTLYVHYPPIFVIPVYPRAKNVHFYWFLVQQRQNTRCVFDWDKGEIRLVFIASAVSCPRGFVRSFDAVAFQSEQTAVNWPRPSLVECRLHRAGGLSYVAAELRPVVSSWNIATFIGSIFNSKKNWARYDQECISGWM